MERQYTDSLQATIIPKTHLVAVNCRTTVCQLTFQHDGNGRVGTAARILHAISPPPGDVLFDYSEDGTNITMYVAREGKQLPRSVN
jgi:hypothetical protein